MELEIMGAFIGGLICGLFFGTLFGVFLMCLANISASADK